MSYVSEPEVVKTEKTVDPAKKIFIDGDDKNVAKTVIYSANKTKFTYDAEGKKEVPAADMFALFVKGVVCVYNKVYYNPTTCTEAGVITFPFPS